MQLTGIYCISKVKGKLAFFSLTTPINRKKLQHLAGDTSSEDNQIFFSTRSTCNGNSDNSLESYIGDVQHGLPVQWLFSCGDVLLFRNEHDFLLFTLKTAWFQVFTFHNVGGHMTHM